MTVKTSFVALTFTQQFLHLTKHGVLGSVRTRFRKYQQNRLDGSGGKALTTQAWWPGFESPWILMKSWCISVNLLQRDGRPWEKAQKGLEAGNLAYAAVKRPCLIQAGKVINNTQGCLLTSLVPCLCGKALLHASSYLQLFHPFSHLSCNTCSHLDAAHHGVVC